MKINIAVDPNGNKMLQLTKDKFGLMKGNMLVQVYDDQDKPVGKPIPVAVSWNDIKDEAAITETMETIAPAVLFLSGSTLPPLSHIDALRNPKAVADAAAKLAGPAPVPAAPAQG